MTNEKKIEITFTRQQFDTLSKLFYLGKWMLESNHDDFNTRFKEEQKLEQFIFAHGSSDLVEFSSDDKTYYPTEKLEEEMERVIQEYEAYIFWTELSERLASRDIEREFEGKLTNMKPEEHIRLLQRYSDKYSEEFEENGFKNLRID